MKLLQPDPEEPSWFARHRLATALGLALFLGLGGFAVHQLNSGKRPAPRLDSITMVSLPPPPPPAPTPPPEKLPPPPEPEKMIAQEPINEPEPKPEDQKPPDEPPPSTGIQGNGPADGFGLSSKGGGNFLSQGSGKGAKASRWGWYAGAVQTRIAELLRENQKTRLARFEQLEVRIWPDTTGRIQRAALANTTGNRAVDTAIETEVLRGAQLNQAPPSDMPLPIVLRLKATRPH